MDRKKENISNMSERELVAMKRTMSARAKAIAEQVGRGGLTPSLSHEFDQMLNTNNQANDVLRDAQRGRRG